MGLFPFIGEAACRVVLLLILYIANNARDVLVRDREDTVAFLPLKGPFEFQGDEAGAAALELFRKLCRSNCGANGHQHVHMILRATDSE
jgi:hypothetical protein